MSKHSKKLQNIQEANIRLEKRVLTEGINTPMELHLKKVISRVVDTIKAENKDLLDQSKKIIDPYKIIDKFKNYLISRVPDAVNQMKTGKGGAMFAYDCYVFLKNTIDEEMKTIGYVKKNAIKLLAGNKETLKKQMNGQDISYYTYMYKNLLSFGYYIGWMDEIEKYEDNVFKWDKDGYDWMTKNEKNIKTEIINKIINYIYS